MEKWLMVIASNCNDKEREVEFNEWYDNIHIPDVLSGCTDFKRAIRYKILGGDKKSNGKYLAIYEIETSDINKTMEAHAENMQNVRKKGRFTDLFSKVYRHVCKVEAY